jgi:F-box-like
LGDDSRRPVSGNERALLQLPASILEHVLLYLEDKAVASMCAVCKNWHQEIGKHSGNLWKHLLQRRKWPIPSSNFYDSPTSDPAVERVVLQRAFISHYTAVRDLTGIQQGISAVLYRKKINEREGCFRSFDSSRRSPQQGNPSVSLKIWSPNRFLAAYQQDCTLRLFDSVERSGGGGGHRLCRELVSRSMDPYQSTKKRGCILLDMGLDEESIGALLHVREDGSNAEAFILTVILREDFLIDDQDAEYEATTRVIDIGQSVLNYLLSCEDVGHGLLQLHDFIRDGGDLDDVEVLVSPTLEACGYGRFMTEVSVSIPNIEIDTDDDSGQVMNLLFRRFCLFSSSMGAIVWMADNTMLSRNEQFALSSCRIEEGGRYGCRIAAAACDSPYVVVLSIDPSGDWQQPTPIMELPFDLQDIIEDCWLSRQSLDRPVVVFDDDIVVAQNTIVDYGEGKKKYLSRLLVLPFTAGTRESAAHTILLDGDVVVQHLVNLRSTHILALCKVFTKTSRETNGGQGNLNDIAGHWFGGGPDGTAWSTGVVSYGILIDFPSRQEIQRICLVENYDTIVDISEEDVLPLLVAASEETVAASVWWSGVVMTGESVRKSTQQEGNQRDHATESSKLVSAKKKKKKTLKKVGKKDGFARGMSLRG